MLQRINIGAHPLKQVPAKIAGELAVAGKCANIEVNVAVNLISVIGLEQGLHNLDHLGYVVGSPGKDLGFEDVHPLLVAVETFRVVLGDFPDALALGQGGQNHFVAAGLHHFLSHMSHVGDVLDVVDLNTLLH